MLEEPAVPVAPDMALPVFVTPLSLRVNEVEGAVMVPFVSGEVAMLEVTVPVALMQVGVLMTACQIQQPFVVQPLNSRDLE